MYQTESFRKPLMPDQYRLTERPMQDLRQCACGRMTFFNLPCANCGEVPDVFVFSEKTEKQKGSFRLRLFVFVLGGGILLTVAGYLLTSWVFALIFFLLTLTATSFTGLMYWGLGPTDRMYVWRLHGEESLFSNRTAFPVVNPRRLEVIMDAWYLDMDRLERMGLRGDWAKALYGARWLSSVYHNPRLSRLMLQAHLQLRTEGWDCYDLDEICANLTEHDISPEDTVPFLNLVERVVREHGCQNDAELKRLFAGMLRRHLEQLGAYTQINELLDAVGEDLIRACGVAVKGQQGNRIPIFPTYGEGFQAFLERLVQELSRHRREFVDNGKWIAVFLALDKLSMIDPARNAWAVRELELCYFHREEHLEPDNLLDAIRDWDGTVETWDIRLLHPEQRRAFAEVLGRWETDELERPYQTSAYSFLRQLYAESYRGRQKA